MILYTTETIHHFTCQECSNWWSYATSEDYLPDAMACPHCGIQADLHDNNLPKDLERKHNEIYP